MRARSGWLSYQLKVTKIEWKKAFNSYQLKIQISWRSENGGKYWTLFYHLDTKHNSNGWLTSFSDTLARTTKLMDETTVFVTFFNVFDVF